MHIPFRLATILFLALPAALPAAECEPVPVSAFTADPGPVGQTEIGSATRAWLDFQCSGQAAGAAHPQTGEAASRSYARYLKSFEHPIPDFYTRDSFIKD